MSADLVINKEETETGDVAKSEPPLGTEPQKRHEPECREPDGKHNNCAVFNIDSADNFKKIIDGRKTYYFNTETGKFDGTSYQVDD